MGRFPNKNTHLKKRKGFSIPAQKNALLNNVVNTEGGFILMCPP